MTSYFKKNILFACVISCFGNNAMAQLQFSVDAGPDQEICLGAYTVLNAVVQGGVSPYRFIWTPDDELDNSQVAKTFVTTYYSKTYTVNVTDAIGNIARDYVRVNIIARPQVDPMEDLIISSDSTITLIPRVAKSEESYTYDWRPMLGLSNHSVKNPSLRVDKSTTYTLLVKNAKGCISSQKVNVFVKLTSKKKKLKENQTQITAKN